MGCDSNVRWEREDANLKISFLRYFLFLYLQKNFKFREIITDNGCQIMDMDFFTTYVPAVLRGVCC